MQKKMSATAAAVLSVNTSYKKGITPQILINIFKGKAQVKPWEHHLEVFFTELPASLIKDFLKENSLTQKMLVKVHCSLPNVLQNKRLKEIDYE